MIAPHEPPPTRACRRQHLMRVRESTARRPATDSRAVAAPERPKSRVVTCRRRRFAQAAASGSLRRPRPFRLPPADAHAICQMTLDAAMREAIPRRDLSNRVAAAEVFGDCGKLLMSANTAGSGH